MARTSIYLQIQCGGMTLMIAMCERCYGLTEGLVLTEVEGLISNPMGVSLVLLCEMCRREDLISNIQKKCVHSCAANPKLDFKIRKLDSLIILQILNILNIDPIRTWGRPELNRRPTGHYSSKLTSSVSQFSLVNLWSP